MEFIETERGLAADLTIKLSHGLHSRPSAKIAQTARGYDANVQLISEDGEVDAKSMLDVLSLALKRNARVRLLANGSQAKEALTAIASLLSAGGE